MAFLHKRKDSGYYTIIEKKKGKVIFKKSTGTRNKQEANFKLNEFLNDKKKFKIKDILLSDFIPEYINSKASEVAADTLSAYRSVLFGFMRFIKDKYLADYSMKDFDKYLSHKILTTSKETASCHKRALVTAFNKAVDWEYIVVNPVPKSKKIQLDEPDIKFFTKPEFKKLLAGIDTYQNKDQNKKFMSAEHKQFWKDLFTFAAYSGLRFNEQQHLRPEHVLIRKKLLFISSDAFHRTKGKRSRYVELHSKLIPVYERYKHQEFIFLGNGLKSRVNVDYANKTLKKFLKHAGIKKDLNIKALRATFGMWLLDAGIDLKFISQQLGHSSIQTTEKHYAKYITTERKGYVDKI